jgi:hypothetical protein
LEEVGEDGRIILKWVQTGLGIEGSNGLFDVTPFNIAFEM